MIVNIQEVTFSQAAFRLEHGFDHQAQHQISFSSQIQALTRSSRCLTSNQVHNRWRQRLW